MCTLCRRGFLFGAAALASHTALPAWAQFSGAIKPQSDPYAQVDPYADPRNGFPSAKPASPSRPKGQAFLEQSQAMTLSDQEEVALGRVLHKRWVVEAGGANADPRLQKAIQAFCAPFFAASNRSNLPWHVTLVNNPSYNASAGPGGQVIIHTGILTYYEHPGELASTIAHEVGHVDLQHSMRSRGMNELIGRLRQRGGALTDQDLARVLVPEGEGTSDALTFMDNAFSIRDEEEADQHIGTLFNRLGIDVRYAVSDMRKAQHMTDEAGGQPSIWATNHPLDPDRIRALEMLAATSSRPRRDLAFAGWDELHAAFPTKPKYKGIW